MSYIKKKRILIVDDIPDNITLYYKLLGDAYTIQAANDGASACRLAAEDPQPDLILLDVLMPQMDGFEVCRILKNSGRTRGIPVIFNSALDSIDMEIRCLKVGGIDFIRKPINEDLVKIKIEKALNFKDAMDFQSDKQNYLEKIISKRTEELEQLQDVMIQSLASLAETRDNETGGHIVRTSNYMWLLSNYALKKNLYPDELSYSIGRVYSKAAVLHDIGKVGIPDSILLKKGKLTPREYDIMKLHTTMGYETLLKAEQKLGANSFIHTAQLIAHTHHERWDGTGYPMGLKGEEIPLPGRFMAIADVYDALISERIYKPAFPHKKAIAIIEGGLGTQFDPHVAECFLASEENFMAEAFKNADSEEQKKILMEGID